MCGNAGGAGPKAAAQRVKDCGTHSKWDHLGCSNKCLHAIGGHCQRIWACLKPPRNGTQYGTEMGSKKGQIHISPEIISDGMHKTIFLWYCVPKGPGLLRNGPLETESSVASKTDDGPFGMPKRLLLACFEYPLHALRVACAAVLAFVFVVCLCVLCVVYGLPCPLPRMLRVLCVLHAAPKGTALKGTAAFTTAQSPP